MLFRAGPEIPEKEAQEEDDKLYAQSGYVSGSEEVEATLMQWAAGY